MSSPSDLYVLLSQHCDLSLPAKEIADTANKATTKTPVNSRVTTATLLDALDPEEFATVRTTLSKLAEKSPYADGIKEALAGQGVLFSDERAQGFIRQLGLPKEITNSLLNLGVISTPVFPDKLTEKQVQSELNAEKLRKRIINATALASEKITSEMSDKEKSEAWADVWGAAGV